MTTIPLRFATVLSRSTGHYLIDGRTGRTVMHTPPGSSGVVYRLAAQRGYTLVNETSVKGQAILEHIHNHTTTRPKAGTIISLPIYR